MLIDEVEMKLKTRMGLEWCDPDVIVTDYYWVPKDQISFLAKAICYLSPKSPDNPDGFEPKPDETVCPECHGTGRHYYASSSGGTYEDICISCKGIGRERLLQEANKNLQALLVEAHKQERVRVERIQQEIEDCLGEHHPDILVSDWWQEFWKKELE